MADKERRNRPDPGANAGWAALGTLLSGVLVWAGIGALLDWLLDIPNHLGLVAGMVVGAGTAVYVIMKRFG
jgi:ATP synthase protein I